MTLPFDHARRNFPVSAERRFRRLGVGLAVVAVTACAACSSSDGSGPVGDGGGAASTDPALDPGVQDSLPTGAGGLIDDTAVGTSSNSVQDVPTSGADLETPLSIGELVPPSPATSEVIWAATQKLTMECMTDRGFEYPVLPSPDYARAWASGRNALSMSQERAETIAYHSVQTESSPEFVAASARLEQLTSDPTYLAALGAQSGEAQELGCSLLAQQQLDTGVDLESEAFNDMALSAESDVASAVLADSGLRAAEELWAQCMSGAGLSYRAPQDAFGDPQWATPEVSEEERRVALLDAQCRIDSDLDTAIFEAQRAAIEEWAANNPTVIGDLDGADEAMLDAARRVLED